MAKDVGELFPAVWAGGPAVSLLAAKASPSHRERAGRGKPGIESCLTYLDPQTHKTSVEVKIKKFRERYTFGRVGGRTVEGHVNPSIVQSWTSQLVPGSRQAACT